MPWFGQGGKKNKSTLTTELQNQRSKQIESLKKGNLNVTEAVRDSEYRVSFQVVGNNVALVICLPAQFPQEKPVVTVEPGVKHPWVDQQMRVTGCPNINNFTIHSSLYTAVQAIVEEFMSRPPAIAHTPYSPVRSGYPSLFPSTTTNIFNIYPSMPAVSAQSSTTAEPTVSPSQSADPISSPTAVNGFPDGSQIDVFKTFPDLKTKTNHELMELLEEEDKILELIQTMPDFQKVLDDREKVSCNCKQLAKENLNHKPVIADLKQQLKDKHEEFDELRCEFERHQEQQLSLMDQFHPTHIQNNLKVAILEAEEESDKIVEDFLHKKIDVDEFQQTFHDKRTLYHARRAKEEKLNRMNMDQGYH